MLASPKGAADVRRRRGAVLAVLLLAASVVATAARPTVRVTFKDGLVWLSATDATAAQILAEWSRVGSTRIVNAERISGPPLNLELNGVREMDALAILLRSTGGFIASARVPAASAADAPLSGVEQITLLPVNARPIVAPPQPPANPPPDEAPAPPPVFDPSGAQRVIGPDGQPVPDDQEGAPAPPPPAPPPSAEPPR
jgi:hypothetical protein